MTLVVLGTLPGDYNDDRVVDVPDYTVWCDNFGAPAGAPPNDTDRGAQFGTWATKLRPDGVAVSRSDYPGPRAFDAGAMLRGGVTLALRRRRV